MNALILIIAALQMYTAPIRVPSPDKSKGPDRWYGCATGTLGTFVEDGTLDKDGAKHKVFKVHTRQVYSDNDAVERQVPRDRWVCQEVTK